MVAPEYVLSRTGSATTRARSRHSRTRANGTSTSRWTFAGSASSPRALSADATMRNERSGSRRASSARSWKSRRGSAPTRRRRPPAGRPARVGSARCPRRTRRTRPAGRRSRATRAAPRPRPSRTRRSCGADETRRRRAVARPAPELLEALGKADRGVDDRRLHAPERARAAQAGSRPCRPSSRRRRSGSARRATRGHERSRPSTLRRAAPLRSSTRAAARADGPARTRGSRS